MISRNILSLSASLDQRSKTFFTEIDNFLFAENSEDKAIHSSIYQSHSDDDSSLPLTLVIHLKKEMKTGLYFNYLLSALLFTYLPANFLECWICDSAMTTWITTLSSLNTILLVPKHLLLRRMNAILNNNDSYVLSYLTWNFFRSKIYKFNLRVSKLIFVVYIVGSLLIWWSKLSNCLEFFTVNWMVLLFFAARVIISSSTFSKNLAGHQNAAVLLEYFNGATAEKISSLKNTTFEEHRKNKEHFEQTCSICHEDYILESKVRIMECPGGHAFHNKCIDRWLLKSEKCPLCNCSVFQIRNQKKN